MATRQIRCQRCPVLIPAKRNQNVGLCPKCRVASAKDRARRRAIQRYEEISVDPYFIRCCDCPQLHAYWGGVPSPRCPKCTVRHEAEQAAKPVRARRRHDDSCGREELHAARGGVLRAYLRGR